jgi:hypothetical protein
VPRTASMAILTVRGAGAPVCLQLFMASGAGTWAPSRAAMVCDGSGSVRLAARTAASCPAGTPISVSRTPLSTERRDSGWQHRVQPHLPAINRPMAPSRQSAGRWPEVRDGLAAVKHRRTGEVLDGVDVEEHPKRHAPLPLVRPVLRDADDGGQTTRSFVGEGQPEHLGDAVGVHRPNPHPEGAGVLHGGEAIIQVLHGALPAEDVVDDLRPPREGGQSINVQVHTVAHVGVDGLRHGAPRTEVHLEAVPLEGLPLGAHQIHL